MFAARGFDEWLSEHKDPSHSWRYPFSASAPKLMAEYWSSKTEVAAELNGPSHRNLRPRHQGPAAFQRIRACIGDAGDSAAVIDD
jgi:hypothetical protein